MSPLSPKGLGTGKGNWSEFISAPKSLRINTYIKCPQVLILNHLHQHLSPLDAILMKNAGRGCAGRPRLHVQDQEPRTRNLQLPAQALRRRTQMRLVAGLPRCMVFPLERSVIVSSYSRFSTSTVVDGRRRSPSRNSKNCASFS